MEPAAAQGFGIGYRVLPIALHHAVAAGDHLADFTRRDIAFLLVDDPDQHAGPRIAAGGEPVRPARVVAVGVQPLRQAGDRHRRFALPE